MIAALVWLAACCVFLGIHAWMHPQARAYRAYRRSIAAQTRIPRQRRATKES